MPPSPVRGGLFCPLMPTVPWSCQANPQFPLSVLIRHHNQKAAPTRPEIESRFSAQIQKLNWKGEGFDGFQSYKTFGIFCVPDLYIPRT